MDMAAIKAYSSVIADAAEDSTPAVAVVYHETIPAEESQKKADPFNGDPMASMIQNEISDIKDASIAAAKDKEWVINQFMWSMCLVGCFLPIANKWMKI